MYYLYNIHSIQMLDLVYRVFSIDVHPFYVGISEFKLFFIFKTYMANYIC